MTATRIPVAVLVMLGWPQLVLAVSPTAGEMYAKQSWVAAKFGGHEPPVPSAGSLTVLANNDPVQMGARIGRPLKIVDAKFRRGLFCHAVSKVVVRLPGPGKTFLATIGVDSNEQTQPGKGTVVFSVHVGAQQVFRSPVLREGMAGRDIEIDLKGATEFVLEVGDGGDGISSDQADWADARVVLADDRIVRLDELPVVASPHRQGVSAELPFSFTYGGRPWAELLKTWTFKQSEKKLDAQRSAHERTYTDPKTGLVVRCMVVEYHDFPIVEWTLHFKNTGSADTPILADLLPLDIRLARPPIRPIGPQRWGEFVLHHQTGSPATPYDYEPHRTVLEPKADVRITTTGGRPTNSDLPYFNIEWLDEGLIAVVGWPGQWAAQFTRDDQAGLHVRAGQELTHFTLHPGEEVRSPLIVLQFWKGDYVRAQNIWRRWMLAHNVPRPGGRPLGPQMAACSSHQFGEMINANTENQTFFIDRYLAEGLKIDYWWMDAGWYPNKTGWPNTGTWEVDRKRFPGGLRSIADHAHAKGVQTIVWFEPERVTPGTWLYEKHPEWLLGSDGQQKLLNLGNPDARVWLTDHVDRMITEQGIDLYRQDFNIDPLSYWRGNDAKDRQGITEIHHVEGYLAYWDALRRRHPNMLIDSCASGGRRNDLETLRRAVPLLRSDYILEPVGNQNHTYGISFWIPFFGTGVNQFDAYGFLSCSCPQIIACYDMRRKDQDYAAVRGLVRQWREEIAPNYFGDYYPLSPYGRDNTVWMVWQFDRPEQGKGMVQAFRRAECIYEVAHFPLRGLDPEARYAVRDIEDGKQVEMTGRELMGKGVRIEIDKRPGTVSLVYKRLDGDH